MSFEVIAKVVDATGEHCMLRIASQLRNLWYLEMCLDTIIYMLGMTKQQNPSSILSIGVRLSNEWANSIDHLLHSRDCLTDHLDLFTKYAYTLEWNDTAPAWHVSNFSSYLWSKFRFCATDCCDAAQHHTGKARYNR